MLTKVFRNFTKILQQVLWRSRGSKNNKEGKETVLMNIEISRMIFVLLEHFP